MHQVEKHTILKNYYFFNPGEGGGIYLFLIRI